MHTVQTIEALEEIYGAVGITSTVKESTRLTSHYRSLIEASPFVALATSGPEGLDCSPRGDRAGVVRIHDDNTVMMPDRRGNNRVDSLRNIVRDPRVALLFLIPGSGTTMRLNGRAVVSVDPELLQSFAVDNKLPRSVVVISIDVVYFQCARAVVRSKLWDAESHRDLAELPTPGMILENMSGAQVDGQAYDEQWPHRAARTLW